jgi:HEAT repeat protein
LIGNFLHNRRQEKKTMRDKDYAGRADLRTLATSALLAETERHLASEDHWDYVVALHFRPEETVFQAASLWCASSDSNLRSLGAAVLSQLGVWDRPFREESLPILWPLLEDPSVDVLTSTVDALGHLNIAGDESRLLPLLGHESAGVRHSIACAIGTLESDLAVTMLIQLSEDSDTKVRDWATFGLGSQIDTDSEDIRDALLRRLTDTDDETRGEAFVGLARRKDKRVVAPLLDELSSDCVGTLVVEAAREIAAPQLLEALMGLTDWWDVNKRLLNEAIAACGAQGTDTQHDAVREDDPAVID